MPVTQRPPTRSGPRGPPRPPSEPKARGGSPGDVASTQPSWVPSGGIRNAQASPLSDACRRERRNPSSVGARTDTSVSKEARSHDVTGRAWVGPPQAPCRQPRSARWSPPHPRDRRLLCVLTPGRPSAAGNGPRPPPRSHLGGAKCPRRKSEGRDAAVAGPYRIEGGHLRVEALPTTEVLSQTEVPGSSGGLSSRIVRRITLGSQSS